MQREIPDDVAALWSRVRGDLEATLPPTAYQLWVEPLQPVSTSGQTLYLVAPSERVRTWVERKYTAAIARALALQAPGLDRIELLGEQASAPGEPDEPVPDARRFEGFVIGSANRFAHYAALAVAEMPGEAYNPLFLHGPPGTGKTHLLGAIADYLRRLHPGMTIRSTTAERFTSEFVSAIRKHGNDASDAFKARHRQVDALLVDDVQFLEDKLKTGEEFFHVFNAVRDAGGQIVISSDRPPRELQRLAERLRDRFEWGLCAELQPADARTRLAVLQRLAETRAPELAEPQSTPVLQEISANCSNLRQLEGALTRVAAFSSVMGETPTTALVRDLLSRSGPDAAGDPPPARPATAAEIDAVREAVCDVFHLSVDELLAKGRKPAVSKARQLAIYVARERLGLSLSELARAFERDRSTVLHSLRTIEKELAPGTSTAAALEGVRNRLSTSTEGVGHGTASAPASPPTPEAVPPPANALTSRTIGGKR